MRFKWNKLTNNPRIFCQLQISLTIFSWPAWAIYGFPIETKGWKRHDHQSLLLKLFTRCIMVQTGN